MQNYPDAKLLTVAEIMVWGSEQFEAANLTFAQGTDNAWDEMFALLMYVLDLPPDVSTEVLNDPITENQRDQLIKLIHQRIAKRMPAAYLTHQAWFAGLKFYVDERVLIPRSPFGELICKHFEPWLLKSPSTILDLCTGSGCMAIACEYAFPEALIDAVDIDADALKVASKNINDHQSNVNLIQSDLFTNLQDKKYDLIISNPPYIADEELQAMPGEFTHEPAIALAGGDDGLTIVEKIIRNAINYLTYKGVLIVEVGYTDKALETKYPQYPFTWIEFEYGGHGIFCMTADECRQFAEEV